MNFEEEVLSTICKYHMIDSSDRILVGLSGGADSSALLLVLKNLSQRLGITLVAAHLNHGIRGEEALRDEEFSSKLCEELGVEFISKKVCVPSYAKEHKLSEEMAARVKRYEFFFETSTQYNCSKIAVAHNSNDNAETILLNLIRGSGSKGIEGISPVNNTIIRPLIRMSRFTIEEYLTKNGKTFVTDSTNLEDIYARNIIRNNVIDSMQKINTAALDNIIRCSEIIAKESEYIDSVIKNLNMFTVDSESVKINRSIFESLHPALARRSVFEALRLLCNNVINVSSKQVELLCSNIKTGNRFSFGNGAYAYISAYDVVFHSKLNDELAYEYKVNVPGSVTVKETGITYKFEFTDHRTDLPYTICVSVNGTEDFVLRTKKAGDCFVPYGMTGNKKIKSFFIDEKIPMQERCNYPLLSDGKEILAVVPLRINDKFKVTNSSKKILMITQIGGTYDKQ